MQDLKLSLIQSSIIWENRHENLLRFEKHIMDIDEADIILLPEMFTTGFTMNPEDLAEAFDTETMETLNWMRKMAKKKGAVICGSVSVSDCGRYFNRLFWVRPDGSFSTYDKRHLFTFAGEHEHYNAGKELLIEEYKGWKICPLICYDLRFPVWSRNGLVNGQAKYDVLIYIANWPEVRKDPWSKLLYARAIENQCYTLGLNRVGEDGTGKSHSGNSIVLDSRGDIISQLEEHKEHVQSVVLSYDDLQEFRRKFPVLNDAD